jgi:hypothetical protein
MTDTIIYSRSEPIDIGPAAEVVVRKVEAEPHEPKSFQEAVNAIRKREGGSRCAALTKAAAEFPILLEKYQAEGLRQGEQARAEPIQKADAVIAWNKLVNAIRSRDGCSNADAMRRAADEHPAELKAYREA